MGYVKRKVSNAGKVTVIRFQEVKEEYLADIIAEVVMNEIPHSLIINWDQTALKYVPAGDWTMNKAGEKVIQVAGSDDKRQFTAVLAVSLTGNHLPPQLIYQGTTKRCHPSTKFPDDWDIWQTSNHWSNESTMVQYFNKIILPYISQQKKILCLPPSQRALVIIDGFRGQNTVEFLQLLEDNNISVVSVPANCTDVLQPLDLSINKPMKDHMKRSFQTWYALEVTKQLQKGVPIDSLSVSTQSSDYEECICSMGNVCMAISSTKSQHSNKWF